MINQQEFEIIINDDTKEITGNLVWESNQDGSPALRIKANVISQAGYPLFVAGIYNDSACKLSYAIIHRGTGRIYALDLGSDHRNPDGTRMGEMHKHCWRENFREKYAYIPKDITAPWHEPVKVWTQFCVEAKLKHSGTMHPPIVQMRL